MSDEPVYNSPLARWQESEDVTLKYHALRRAVLNLDKMEGLALIRAAYHPCSLSESLDIWNAIMKGR